MSKEKKEKIEKTDKTDIDEILKKQYGNVFISGSSLIEKEPTIISVGPTLDIILGGGIQAGGLMIITGKQKLGKTTLCLQIAAEAQKQGFYVYYFDIEGRVQKRDLVAIEGLKIDDKHFTLIRSNDDDMLNGEEYLDMLIRLMETKRRCVFIVDSVSQLCSKERHESNIGDRFRDNMPLILASFTKRVSNILPVKEHVLICITHIMANMGNGYSPWAEASGTKLQYAANCKLRATHKEDYTVGDKLVGQLVHFECDFSNIGPPGGKCTTLLRYGKGLDKTYDLISMCIDIGLLNKAAGGGWITFKNDAKVQGMEKACDFLKENPQIYDELVKELQEVFK